MTFSIAARDGDAWGVAVASKFLAVGSVVPAVRLGVGAVATQSLARVAYLDEVLDALEKGDDVRSALDAAVAGDGGRALGDEALGDAGRALGAASAMPWVLEPAGTASREWAEQLCREAGFEPDVRFETADLMAHLPSRGQADYQNRVLSAMHLEFGGHVEMPAGP